MSNKKLNTISTVCDNLHKRLRMAKNKTINVQIAVANGDIKALGVVVENYTKDFEELDRMIKAIEKMVEEIKELN